MTDSHRLELVAAVVGAYFAHNRLPVAELPALGNAVHQALQAAPAPENAGQAASGRQTAPEH